MVSRHCGSRRSHRELNSQRLTDHRTSAFPHYLRQLVELKNGETFNGHLVNCDNFMNITLREVYQTSAEGDRFWKLKECYIRGSTVSFSSPYAFVLARVLGAGMNVGVERVRCPLLKTARLQHI